MHVKNVDFVYAPNQASVDCVCYGAKNSLQT